MSFKSIFCYISSVPVCLQMLYQSDVQSHMRDHLGQKPKRYIRDSDVITEVPCGQRTSVSVCARRV